MRSLVTLLILIFSTASFGQSGRTPTPDPAGVSAPEQTTRQMYEEASAYVKTKAAEFDAKKIPYSDKLLEDTRKEQRSLAARYAAAAALRKDLTAEDFYYIGMLEWIATNLDKTIASLTKFLSASDTDPTRAQTARYTTAVSLAKQGDTDHAEKMLIEYVGKSPVKPSEEWRINVEIAKAYDGKGDLARMAPFAATALNGSVELLKDPQMGITLDHVLDVGMLAFKAYAGLDQKERAEASLETLRAVAVDKGSPSLYFYATDKKIRFLIDTGRKSEATALYDASLASIAKDFSDQKKRDDATRRFREVQKAYALLGSRAPEFQSSDQDWFPGKAVTLSDVQGKVVLLDFWAMWCQPCVEALPELKAWHEEFSGRGFEIIGLTRYFGSTYGYPADHAGELALVRSFAAKKQLPYDIVVSDGQSAQIAYGAMLLPTAVLIDRKGVVRYVATGTNPSRTAEIREMIVKLLAEK